MKEFTPLTEQVRGAYAAYVPTYVGPRKQEFDRWLAQHDAEVVADAMAVEAAEDLHEREGAAFRRESDVRCAVCDLRYGEQDEYSCEPTGTQHVFDEDELIEARKMEPQRLAEEYARALAAHDAKVRKQVAEEIAAEIKKKMLGEGLGRLVRIADGPGARLHLAYDDGLGEAADIAREIGGAS